MEEQLGSTNTEVQKTCSTIPPGVNRRLWHRARGKAHDSQPWESSFQRESLCLNRFQKCFSKVICTSVVWEEVQRLVPNKDSWHWRGCYFNYNNMMMAFLGKGSHRVLTADISLLAAFKQLPKGFH